MKSVSPAKKVKAAIKEYLKLHPEGSLSIDNDSKDYGNIRYTLRIYNCSIIFIGKGKGNSEWQLRIKEPQQPKVARNYDSLENLVEFAPINSYRTQFIRNSVKTTIKRVCNLIKVQPEFEIEKDTKKYDAVLFRRAKKDLKHCLQDDSELYHNLISEVALQLLELDFQSPHSPDNEDMLIAMERARVTIQTLLQYENS